MKKNYTDLMTMRMRRIFRFDEIDDLISLIEFKKVKKNKITYYNCACSFDIETSSFYDIEQLSKAGCMYIWMMNISGLTIIGRTWDEWIAVLSRIRQLLEINIDQRLVIYVHNLSFEFQWIRKRLKWDSVFSLNNRKVCKALTTDGFEFRCSYILTNKSLEKVAEDLPDEYNGISKLIGNLDYSEIRSPQTDLTQEELDYCVNDVLIITYLIYDKLVNENNIANIPLTATGYVRKAVRKHCLYNKEFRGRSYRYNQLMRNLTLTAEDYEMLKDAFMGGFTHASALHSNMVLQNVGSIDFTSAYPSQMVKELYPMSKWNDCKIVNQAHFQKMIDCYCCLFDIEFTNIRSKTIFEHILSESKCKILDDAVIDNGRVVEASRVVTTLTEVDYKLFTHFYEWDKIRIARFKWAYRGYLPTLYVESILDFYEKKTSLKGVTGKEKEYMLSKSLLNSTYGMMCTDICMDSITYVDDEWCDDPADIEECIEHYNNSKSRFINFSWGIYVTAYCRRDLLMAILYEFKTDYVYSDTDSIKFLHPERHMEFIDKYNQSVIRQTNTALDYMGLSRELGCPETIKGEKKYLGVFEFEGIYDRFKTLGAKRYLTEKNGEYSLTCSGLSPYEGSQYISMQKDPFTFFSDQMLIPGDYTGKLTHTYLDDEMHGVMTDKDGFIFTYDEKSAVHLEKQEYDLSLASAYKKYLKGVLTYVEN